MLPPDIESLESMNNLRQLYIDKFSLGYLNTDISNKFALISLINYLTYKAKKKSPDITHYKIITKLCEGLGLPIDFIKRLSIICEDFGYNCTEFPTFNIEDKKIVGTIKNILKSYAPF